MDVRIHRSSARLGAVVAEEIHEILLGAEGRELLLGIPSGRSAMPVLGALSPLLSKSQTSLRNTKIVALDSYVEQKGGVFRLIDDSLPHSAKYFMQRHIMQVFNRHLAVAQRLQPNNLLIPDPQQPELFDDMLRQHQGMDYLVLASGASDGHVGFNAPGSPASSQTRVVELPLTTRIDNLSTYPHLGSVEHVPTHGVTLGIEALASSKRAVLVIHGQHKSGAFEKIVESPTYRSEWPSSVIHLTPGATIHADVSAAHATP